MVNNYSATLKDIARFLCNFAPAGAERDVNRLHADLAADSVTPYMSFEFRPTPDVGCSLYVRLEAPEGRGGSKRVEDEEGNLWHSYMVKCEVSWPSWGTDNLETCQRRLALMTEVTRFACEVERAFPETYHDLWQTKAQREEYAVECAKKRAEAKIRQLVKENAKGMKVGQERRVDGDVPDFAGFVEVERVEAGRVFKYSVIGTNYGAICFTRMV